MIRNTHKLNPGNTVVAYSDNSSIVAYAGDTKNQVGQKTKRFYPKNGQDGQQYGYTEEEMHYLMKVETHNHPTANSGCAFITNLTTCASSRTSKGRNGSWMVMCFYFH